MNLPAILVSLGLLISAGPDARRDARAAVARACDEHLQELEKQGFAGAVFLRKSGKVLLRKGYGFADRGRKVKVEPDMVFACGSITKLFTAVAVLKLQAEGKLRLGDPISRYLGKVPPDKAAITVHHLFYHTSGLPHALAYSEEVIDKDEMIKRTLAVRLISPPGRKFGYSNVGFSLLAAIIEKASGQSYEDYLQKKVIAPAKLKKTGYTAPDWSGTRLVCGFRNGKPWGSVKDYFGKDGPSWLYVGNSGLLTTMEDLDDWTSALLQYKTLSKPVTDRFVGGLTKRTRQGRQVTWAGMDAAFSSVYVRWLDDNLTLIVFTSEGNWAFDKVNKKLLEEVAKLHGRR
jgi:CubicO group peptidase (beta-lactamase class C family)